MVNGDSIDGGFKNEGFKDLIKDQRKGFGALATLMSDAGNKDITQIRVLSFKIKVPDKK